MRRTLLCNCENCKYDTSRCILCGQCKLYTKPRTIGSDRDGTIVKNIRVTCKCLQNATKQELKTGVCKYKEEI